MTQMGRRGGDNQIALDSHHHSSIAMLQERFRQLERAKEIREERELLMMKTLSSSSSSPLSYYQHHYGPTPPTANKHTVNAELLLFPGAAVAKPSSKISLSLWPGADSPVGGFRPGGPTHPAARTSVHGNNWVMMSIKHEHHDDSDYCGVDTSLHL